MAMKNKKRFTKNDFSDQEVYNEIKEEIRQIRDQNLKQVEEERKIMQLYQHKKDKKRKERLNSEALKSRVIDSKMVKHQHDLGEDDEEQGEINQNEKHEFLFERNNEEGFEGMPSISDLGEHIRPITLTRNKICDLLNYRKFEDIVKSCFVRYKCQNTSTNPGYLLAQIIGITQGGRQYVLNNSHRTKILLKLQQTSQQVITLSIQLCSNQHPPGGLQISKWLQTNRNKIPKESQLKEKLKQLTSLIMGKVTSEEIDENILSQAKKIAEGKQEAKGDIDRFINFISGFIHDLNFQIDEMEDVKRYENEVKEKMKKKLQFDGLLQKLKKLKETYEQEQKAKKQMQKEKKEVNKYSQVIFGNRKEDRINEKVKTKLPGFSTYDSSMKIYSQLVESHKKHVFNIQI